MRLSTILFAALFTSACIAQETNDKAEDRRQTAIFDGVADMGYYRDQLHRGGYAVFLESAVTIWQKQKRLFETRPAGITAYPSEGTEAEQQAWTAKWFAADPKTVSKTPPPATGVWNLSISKPSFHYHASAYPTKRSLLPPGEGASEVIKAEVTRRMLEPSAAYANSWAEYFDDGTKIFKFRRYGCGSTLPPWNFKPADQKLPQWRQQIHMAVFVPFDGLLMTDSIHAPLGRGRERLEQRLLSRWELLETVDSLRGQVTGRWRWTYKPFDASVSRVTHTQDTTIVFDPAFGGMPVSIEQVPVGRLVNAYWFKTEVKWKKFGKEWLPIEIDNTRSDMQFGDTETRERTALHWVLADDIPDEWFTADDLRSGLLELHGRGYCTPVRATPAGLQILNRTPPIPVPEQFDSAESGK